MTRDRVYADHAAKSRLLLAALGTMVLWQNDGFALPPHAEQKRIVKRLDEVLKLVEAGQGGKETGMNKNERRENGALVALRCDEGVCK